jgi:hypothetical protein
MPLCIAMQSAPFNNPDAEDGPDQNIGWKEWKEVSGRANATSRRRW